MSATPREVREPAGGACGAAVRRPSMLHDWRDVTFVHWAYPPEIVQRLLPDALEVDTHQGRAWVGIVPFVLSVWNGSGAIGSRFPETNVRTYVRGPDGVEGIWFLSLDAPRTDAVIAARLTHRLPYMRARMTVAVDGPRVRYCSRRRWPHTPAALDAIIRVGEAITPPAVADRDVFLTERFCLYAPAGGTVRRVWATHEPWPLHRAHLVRLRQDLVQAAGVPDPVGMPLVHFSPGVTVRVGPLEPVTTTRGGR